MNVSLTEELANFIKAKVSGGRYASSSEVVREALRLMEKELRNYELRNYGDACINAQFAAARLFLSRPTAPSTSCLDGAPWSRMLLRLANVSGAVMSSAC
jgi:putative addiction module CopG family antidote